MHIGIIIYKNKKIYIDVKNNQIDSYYYNKYSKQSVNINTLLSLLINNLFDKTKEKLIAIENEYKVYINEETGYKHFYKNGKQDLVKFFLENGKNAIMYDEKESSEKLFIGKKVKEFYNKHFSIRFILNFAAIYSALTLTTNALDNIHINTNFQDIVFSITEQNYDSFFNYNQFCEQINSSLYLNNEQKELLYNEALFNDICTTAMSIDRVRELEEKTIDVGIVPFTEQDYQEQKAHNKETGLSILGYYNSLEANILHVDQKQDQEVIKDVCFHEFIHLLQDDNKYHYIKEACAEIISNEYYGAPINSYQGTVKRIKALMETIGSNSIWEMNFSGDDSKLIKILKENLAKEEYNSFCEILETSPSDLTLEDREELNKNFDDILSILYKNIYKTSIENDENIKKIYESSNGEVNDISRTYFNNCNLEDTKIFTESKTVTEALKNNIIDIEFYKTEQKEVSEEEYNRKKAQGEEVTTELYINKNPEIENYIRTELKKYTSPEERKELEEKILSLGYGMLKYYGVESQPVPIENVAQLRKQGANITYNISYLNPEYSSASIVYDSDSNQEKETPIVYLQKKIEIENFKSNNINQNQINETISMRK